jgi:hypothetical protein
VEAAEKNPEEVFSFIVMTYMGKALCASQLRHPALLQLRAYPACRPLGASLEWQGAICCNGRGPLVKVI